MTPRIDVLTVTMGNLELVSSCLAHLQRQTLPHTVWVADNSPDGIGGQLQSRFPHANVVRNEGNIGFGAAVMRLAACGDGDVIVLANDDMDVEPSFLEELVAPLADAAVGMVAGMTLQPGEGDLIDGFGIELDPTLQAYNRLRHRRPGDRPGVLAGPSGGAAAYRRTAWEQVGGLDAAIYLYAEDLDLALRLRAAGWRAAEAAGARGVHLGGASAGRDSEVTIANAGFGRGFVLRRYGVLRTRWGPRALLTEALTVLYGFVRHRSALPLRSRIRGWRAAGQAGRQTYPWDAIDKAITLREQLRRLRVDR
jgi:N-acetylglucosaminyl-diphospho-decaprenol L-rhamnosyltransferase